MIVIPNTSMLEVGDGFYKYDFTSYDPTISYVIFIDGGTTLSKYDRYKVIANSDDLQIANKIPNENFMGSSVKTSLDSTINAIKAKTDNLPVDTNLILTTLATEHARLLGLTHENIHEVHTFSGNVHTGSIVEIYDSKTNAELHDGITGLIAKYTLTITSSGGILQSHTMVRDI